MYNASIYRSHHSCKVKPLTEARGNPMRSEDQYTIWQLIQCSTHERWRRKPHLNDTACILRHTHDCHEKDGACSLAKYRGNARSCEKSPSIWLEELTRPTETERHERRWDLRTARGNPTLCSGEHFAIQRQEPLFFRATQTHSGDVVQPNFLHAQSSKT